MLLIDPTTDLTFLDADVFRVLAAHSTRMAKDFKSTVKQSLRMGRAVSMELNLATRRSIIMRGSERFASHWTPVKNEKGEVGWVIVTLAPLGQDW